MAAERQGLQAFRDKRSRERSARLRAGAEEVVRRWQLLGFSSLMEFLMHRRLELKASPHPQAAGGASTM